MRKKGYAHRKPINNVWAFAQTWKCKYCSYTEERFIEPKKRTVQYKPIN